MQESFFTVWQTQRVNYGGQSQTFTQMVRNFVEFLNLEHTTQSDQPPLPQIKWLRKKISMQTVKRTVSKAKPNSEDHFLTKLSLNSQAEKKAILAAEKLFSHNLRKSLPSLIPSTKIGSTEKPTVTQNLRQKLSESSPGTTKRIWTDEKRLRHKKKSL